MEHKTIELLDIAQPDSHVEVEWDAKRRVLYVHVDGMTVLRVCGIGENAYHYTSTRADGKANKRRGQ